MCGIIGCAGRGEATLETLVDGLRKLDYRGYDSAGVALSGATGVDVVKKAGKLDALVEALSGERERLDGSVGIGHTRWSTHGAPTDANAHPHTDADGRVAVVHNGIIENYQSLRDELTDAGYTFVSETDTEVVPHLVASALDDGMSPEAAVREAVSRLEGSYALGVVVAGVDAVFAARRDSPLVLGLGEGANYVASDVPAFREHTDRVVYLEDGEFARVEADSWVVTDGDGDPVDHGVHVVEWDPEDTGKSGYEHFMLKEIHEQPRALRQGLQGRVDEMRGEVTLEEFPSLSPSRVHLLACGTSYHAAVYGAHLLQSRGIPAQAFYAHEYASATPPTDDALVIGVSQSGETADTLSAVRAARRRGAETVALTNTVESTMARECDHRLYIRSGPEIGVAATKTFASQLVALNLLALDIASGGDDREAIAALRDLPGDVQAVLDSSRAAEVARAYADADAYFFIGRGPHYPVALEGALKLKEISYEHAEGFAAGELKHGPLALVTERTPVFATVTGEGESARKTIGNVKEVEARDAPVVAVTDGRTEVERYADRVLEIPETHPHVAPLLANVQFQLVSYYVANDLGRPIDKPRHLAKSVTVE
jgi:glucosamine--fructose-6-phosphate aminotransferase (isomerizing)